jgi:hypothetical protein
MVSDPVLGEIMRRTLATLLLLGLLPAVAHAQLVQSTFAAGAEGWTNVKLPYPSAVPPTVLDVYTPNWTAATGGYIWLPDPDGSGSSGDCQYWCAPAAYLGNMSRAYGGTLEFDLADSPSGDGDFSQEDLLLVGDGATLVYDALALPTGSFSHYVVPMTESGWKLDGPSGPQPTAGEFRWVLGTLSNLYIRAEYQLGPDYQFLDNVALNAGTLGVSDRAPGSGLAIAAPAPNPSRGAVEIGFALPRAGGATLEVFDMAGRRVATLANGTFAAGPQRAAWDGRTESGEVAAAGLYWARLTQGAEAVGRALVRVR